MHNYARFNIMSCYTTVLPAHGAQGKCTCGCIVISITSGPCSKYVKCFIDTGQMRYRSTAQLLALASRSRAKIVVGHRPYTQSCPPMRERLFLAISSYRHLLHNLLTYLVCVSLSVCHPCVCLFYLCVSVCVCQDGLSASWLLLVPWH